MKRKEVRIAKLSNATREKKRERVVESNEPLALAEVRYQPAAGAGGAPDFSLG